MLKSAVCSVFYFGSSSLMVQIYLGPPLISEGIPLRTAPSSNVAVPVARPVYIGLTASLHRPHELKEPQFVALNPSVFHHPIRRDILHLCVNHYRDSLRQGSANTKTRGEVRGSGRKIRPQKGSGRARLGDAQSPMLRGGGVAFGPKPRDFSTKLPRKVILMGMRVALSSKVLEHNFGVMKTMDWPSGKTRHLSQKIDSLGLKNTLFITGEDEVPTMLRRAIQNIPLVALTTSKEVNVYEMLKWPRIMLDAKAVDFFEQTLCKMHSLQEVSVTSGIETVA
ncbi:ribosomal protein L4 domain-containing protein [Lentinula aciculospora]|uniref:Large ribosomal subunit protein uL4m n=1 Tax=Lentinula aciculospora TaxID=153920 RepID=A0A9W9ALX0_9AGAR|nr:ribosomal protein L4 domain-containing protein [Lentinula aciculospora]